ncbi:MAG: outer membrane lipoprotein-sorting protein [Bacteroidia bacterium]|nr:outer membrane lipoprotein-sorting protein [Bacteroidia bacterium]
MLYLLSVFLLIFGSYQTSQIESDPEALEIVRKVDLKTRGNSSIGTATMTIVRPRWTRKMEMKSWTKGTKYSIILIQSPARDKGSAFLKRDKEIWNWQPRIDRNIKLPPSMMMQSWMGSDFTNDDLVKESSIIEDYMHQMDGEESIDGRDCYRITLIPKPDAAVVWGKILMWVDKDEYIQLKTEFYDEEDYLVNTMYGKAVKNLGGKTLPSILEIVPADKEGHKTVIEQHWIKFDEPLELDFFTTSNMKRVR